MEMFALFLNELVDSNFYARRVFRNRIGRELHLFYHIFLLIHFMFDPEINGHKSDEKHDSQTGQKFIACFHFMFFVRGY